MLVLQRKVGEKILIGDTIEVIVNRIDRGQVSLAISAPPNVAIDREELRERKLAGSE